MCSRYMMRAKVHKRRLNDAAPSNQTHNRTPPCRSQPKTETATPQKQKNIRFRSCFSFYKLLKKKKKKRNRSLLILSPAAEIIFSYQVVCFELVHKKTDIRRRAKKWLIFCKSYVHVAHFEK